MKFEIENGQIYYAYVAVNVQTTRFKSMPSINGCTILGIFSSMEEAEMVRDGKFFSSILKVKAKVDPMCFNFEVI